MSFRSILTQSAFLVVGGCSVALAAGERVLLPIEQHLSTGAILYSVEVSIAGTPVDLLIDSGSVGIRVLGAALPRSLVSEADPSVTVGYANGVLFEGQRSPAHVELGALTTEIPVEEVRNVICAPARPHCPVAKGVNGWLEHLKGLVGISLESPTDKRPVANPLQAVASAWIVHLPEPGSRAPGELILNPDANDLKGFDEFPAGTGGTSGGGRDNPVPGCITNELNGKSFCGPVVLDTGKPTVSVLTDEFKDIRQWRPGLPAKLSFGSGNTAISAKFTVSSSVPPTHVSLGTFPEIGQPAPRILAGAEPFLLFDVLYDAANEKIGLRHR